MKESTPSPKKILLLDIETAYNKAAVYRLKVDYISPKNIIEPGYTLCFSAKWLGKKEVFFAKSPDGHLEMLRQIRDLLAEADAVVHYNGKKFDIPTLNSEFLLHKIKPVKPFVQIDLLTLMRRTFNFPSYALDYVCMRLGLGAKVRHAGIEMWTACMDAKNKAHAKAWEVMERYNKGDVVLLEKLYNRVRPWFFVTNGFKRIHEYLTGLRSNP